MLFVFAFTSSAFAQDNGGPSPEEQELGGKIVNATRIFLEIQAHIQKYYYREVDIKECWERVLAGGLSKCLDPNSSYISPSEAPFFNSEVRGSFLASETKMVDFWSKNVGDIIITEKLRLVEREIRVIAPLGDFRDFPIVILVNNGSASASEIFAGVLRDWGHPVVGVKTYGKGTVQQVIPLTNSGILRLTIAEYLVGNAKKLVHGIGITPNYVVENPEQKLPDDPMERNKLLNSVDPEKDPQLKKAVEVLQGLTADCRNSTTD